jgi:hypothetical protein
MPASQPANFNLQEFSDAGLLLFGGRLYTYAYGTTAQKTAYTDIAGTVPHTYTADGAGGQYIALNARGELPAPLYLATGAYDIALKRADGSTVWTRRADPTGDGAGMVADAISALNLANYTALRAYAGNQKSAYITGYLVALKPAGIAGMFICDDSDITSADNGGTIIVAANGKRWKRVYSGTVTPDWFGALGGTTGTADTAAVQAAIDTSLPVTFTQDYPVDNVTIGGVARTINFNGFGLYGGSNYGADRVLAITGRELKLYNVRVDQGFNNYSSAVRWFSVDASHPAQYNKVFGLHICNATAGVTYGQSIGSISTDAAQSENVIFGYTTRAVQKPWVGNQSNGFMTLVAPVLDCNPYEWSTRAAYTADPTAWNTAALALQNQLGSLVTMGGEFLKTSTQLGYGMRGNGVTMLAPTLEIAGTQGYIDGSFTISDNINGYQSSDSTPGFVIAPGAVGILRLHNPAFARAAGVGGYSGAKFISDSTAAPGFKAVISGGNIVEWPYPLGGFRTECRDVTLTETAATGAKRIGRSEENLLATKGIDTLGYTTTGWYLKTIFGGGTTMSIAAAGPAGYLASSLQLHATGDAQMTTTDETSAATIIGTSFRVRPSEIYRVTTLANLVGGGNSRVVANFYTAAGAVISTVPIIDAVTLSVGSFTEVGGFVRVPATAAYMGIGAYNSASGTAVDVQISDIKLMRA